MAVADTFEAAKAAADAVRATYSKETPNVDSHLGADSDPDVVVTAYVPMERLQSHRGDAAAAFDSCGRQAGRNVRHSRRNSQSYRAALDRLRCGTAPR